MKIAVRSIFLSFLLTGVSMIVFCSGISAQDEIEIVDGKLKVPLELTPEQLLPGSEISIKIQNSAMPLACSGPGNQSVGGFTQCADQTMATPNEDRNDYWNCCAPPGWLPSEAYEYNFPTIETTYPCVAGATVDELILNIKINSVVFDLTGPYACCEQYFEGIYANIYDNCPPGSDCPVAGDGLVNNGNPGTGDCFANGDHLVYDTGTSSFPLGIPFTSTTTCLASVISTGDLLGVDIVPSFFYQDASAAGCNCPQDLISQGFVSIDYDIEVEYVFCSNDLSAGCFPASFTAVGPLCENDPTVTLPTTSNNGVSGSWSPASINPAGQGGNTITATFTPNPGQCVGGTAEMEVMVNSASTPTFNQIGPLCENEPAVPLPSTSTNGVTGTWDVGASFNPAGQGGNTVTITFTPDAGQCADQATMDIDVDNELSPNFNQIGPLCENDPPVALPTTSTNGITGSWDVGANFDPAGQGGNTVTINFTPDAGQCAATNTMDIQVDAEVTPTFAAIGPICETDPPVALPATSNNGISGTWDVGANFNPAGQGGNTVTITFTPNAGQCASSTTLDIVVDEEVNPTFAAIGPVCENDPPVPLPSSSTEGITGTWDVGATFNPFGQGGNTVTINFTPDAGQCASSTSLNVAVQQAIQPSFSPIGPLCETDPPVGLPANSLNGISGTWDVGPTFNPSGQGGSIVTITFTPNAGQCAFVETMDIIVNQAAMPSFSPIAPLCENASPVPLPNTSLNGISGTWDVGASFDPAGQGGNSVTITFTPNAGQCASQADLTISVLDETQPTFSPIGPFCENAAPFALPSQSLEGVSGTWDVGPTFDPTALGGTTSNIIFTPDAGQCAANQTVAVTVNSLPQNTVLDVSCNASLTDYFVEFQTDGDDVSSTAGTVIDNGGGDFTIDNVPEGTDITVTVTNTTTGCTSTFDVTSPSCNCPTIDPPTGNDVEICENEPIPALIVTVGAGLEVDWYDAAAGGMLLLENSTSYTPPSAGSYFAEAVEPSSNCTSNTRTEIELTILPVDTTYAQDSTCNVMEVGMDTTIFTTAACDSVVITTTTLIPASEFFQMETSCDPNDVGLDTLTLTSYLGCDSLVITETTLSPADTSFATDTTCDPMLVGMDTTVYATATCDSVVITTISLLPPDLEFLMATSCNPADVGLDTLVLSNQQGCDSLVITETTLDPLPPTFAQATTCDPMMVGMDTTILSSMGCDSMVITTTTLLPGDEFFQNATSCDPNEVGVDTLVFTNAAGCDSLVITTTTLSAADTTFVPATTCDPMQVGMDTTVYTTATCDSIVITTTTLLLSDVTMLQDTSCDMTMVGLDTLILQNQAGCDSLVITETIFEGLPPTFEQATSCDPMMVGMDTTIFSSMGCDSMVITATTLLPSDETFLNDTSCDPMNVGVDTVFLTNTAGCDSLIITTTTLSAADTTFVPATTCDPNLVGVDTTVFTTPLCDSIVITTTTLLPSDEIFLNALTCDPVEVGVDTVFLMNQNGCDSLVITTTDLDVIPPTFLQATTCEPTEVGVDTMIFATATCDSLVITTTTLLASSETTIEATTCVPAEVGADTLVLVNQAGCDSLVITNTVLVGGITGAEISSIDPNCAQPFGSISIENVEGGEEPYLYSIDGGQMFSGSPDFGQLEEGAYSIVVQDANGCIFEASEELVGGIEPQIIIDPDEVNLNLGDSYYIDPTLTVSDSSIASVVWSPSNFLDCVDCIETNATPLESTTYTVSIIDENGCEASATIAFFVNQKIRVYIPNVFSPNGDGVNDNFTIQGDEKLVANVDELLIFDRWGGNVFENFNFQVNDFASGWDGTWKGKEMQPGVYVYLAFVTLVNGEQVMLEGEVNLVR